MLHERFNLLNLYEARSHDAKDLKDPQNDWAKLETAWAKLEAGWARLLIIESMEIRRKKRTTRRRKQAV